MDTDQSSWGGRLLRRPRPADDEDFRAYLLRLGVANGYTDRQTLRMFIERIKSQLELSDGIQKLADQTGVDERTLCTTIARSTKTYGVAERDSRLLRNAPFLPRRWRRILRRVPSRNGKF
ncbi:hypothetical protein G3A42_41470 [Paraburkholderia aspalathi]|nr:hypothetical protein [Paraburkholderia aspalathi]